MEANIYDGVCVVIKDNGNVVIVSDTSTINLPVLAREFIADNSSYAKEVRGEWEKTGAEVHRQRGVIKDLEGDLAKAIENNVSLSNRIIELEKALKDTIISDEGIVIGVACKAVGHKLVHMDGEFIADCGTSERARNVANALYDGKVTIEQVKLLFCGKNKKWYKTPVEYVVSDKSVLKKEHGRQDEDFVIICSNADAANSCAMLLNSEQISEDEAIKKYDIFELMESMKPKDEAVGE